MRSFPRFTVLLTLTAVVLAGCSSVTGTAQPGPVAVVDGSTAAPSGAPQITDPGTEPPAGSTTAEPGAPGEGAVLPAGLEAYYSQTLEWVDCTELGDEEYYRTTGVDCAYLTVPLSYEEPALADIRIAVLRAASTGGDRIGSLLINPGGPGASGAEFVGTYATLAGNTSNPTGQAVTDLLASFDLIGFDPRGVGASEPQVTCQTNEERDASRAVYGPLTDDSVTLANEATAEIVQSCIDRMALGEVDGATVLSHFGTRDAARDMDVLRAALADEKLSFLGYSYGTKLGYVYAEEFPANVRAMVLDGAVAPDADPATSILGQAAGFQLAFDSFASWCADLGTCPLGNDPAQATAVYQQLSRPLLENPIALSDGRILTYADATSGVAAALYLDGLRQTLLAALLDLSQGRGEALMALADSYLDRDADGNYSNSMEAFNAIRCMDDARLTDLTEATELQQRYNEASPFQDSGRPAGGYLDICAFWPSEPTWTPHRLDIPDLDAQLLVISTTGDPATPYQDGVDLAEQLGAGLLSYTGDRHTAFLGAGSACVDDTVLQYLREPAATGDLSC